MVIFYSYVELPEAIYKWRTVHFHVWLPQDVLVEHVAENVSGWLNDTSPSSSFQWLWGGSPHESLFAFMWTWATTWPRCVINCIASPYIWVYWERSNRTCFFCVPPRLPADRCEAALSEDIPGSQPANLGGFRKGNTTQIKKQKPTPTGMSPTWRTRPFGFCMPFWSPQGCCHVGLLLFSVFDLYLPFIKRGWPWFSQRCWPPWLVRWPLQQADPGQPVQFQPVNGSGCPLPAAFPYTKKDINT